MQRIGEVPEGPVHALSLGREPGVEVRLLDLGATLHSIRVTCGDGVRRELTLGHADVATALGSDDYLGGTIGRVANRVAGARFDLDGETVVLAPNEGRTSLHGGPVGFDKRLWRVVEHDADRAVLELVSDDGDQGFPGRVTARLALHVHADGLDLELTATTDAPTPVALTSHLYLCLGDHGVRDHVLRVDADAVHLVDDESIPLPGPPSPVAGTAYDLREGARIGDLVEALGGLDHDYAVTGEGLREVARLECDATRTRAVLSSDQPDLQVYTGQGLHEPFAAYDALALEPQVVPDAVHRPGAPDVVLRPGQAYTSRIAWRFETTG